MARRIVQIVLACALPMLFGGAAGAGEQVTFERCVDGQGRTLPVVEDDGQAALVRTVAVGGRTEIRYNPQALPRLSNHARVFFYASQCARHGLPDASPRRVDCIALNALLDGGQLKYEDLPALQGELKFSDEEWRLLPGPAHSIVLGSCKPGRGNALSLPLPTEPSPGQVEWNACVRTCADRLWTCQQSRRTRDADCQAAYDGCRGACGK